MIRPYLSDIINNNKTPKNWIVYSCNEVICYKTQFGECIIQLIISINFISTKDFDETRSVLTMSDNIEVMMSSEKWYYWRTFWTFFVKISRRIPRINEKKT